MQLVLVPRMALPRMSMAALSLTISTFWKIVKWMPMDALLLLSLRESKLMTWSLKLLLTKFCVNFLRITLE